MDVDTFAGILILRTSANSKGKYKMMITKENDKFLVEENDIVYRNGIPLSDIRCNKKKSFSLKQKLHFSSTGSHINDAHFSRGLRFFFM